MNKNEAVGLVRYFLTTGISLDEAANNPIIPTEFRSEILKILKEEENIIFQPTNTLGGDDDHTEWLNYEDRSNWYYWPVLRQYLITRKNWTLPSVQSLDRETDRILGRLASPLQQTPFDKRGLVLGYVQSGKTSNYTALIAKAADSGYRFIVVLTGTDNSLRLQTNRRLKKELVGSSDGKGVPLPRIEKQWFEFTRDNLNGDFQPGYINYLPLQAPQPILLVIKKNGSVLRRLLSWLDGAPKEVMNNLPLLIIDDEADLASVDTRGSYQTEDEDLPEDYEAPSVINRLIRDLLNRFNHKSYVAYTATPFANVLIPHDNYDPTVSDDLYPKDFIVDLPKPEGYFGAEELFGQMDETSDETSSGIDVIRTFSEESLSNMERGNTLPPILERAILSFIISGASTANRKKEESFPATMLIHISRKIVDQMKLKEIVEKRFTEMRDEWRYAREGEIYEQLKQLWDEDFRHVIEQHYPDKSVEFVELEPYISTFFESVKIRTLNSGSEDELDYEKEPFLKAIAIGGNKLSRGLTLEGLLVSFFARKSIQYDTLMQMGRWFGFREGYEDLTRIYTTDQLRQGFSDLAYVEHRLREDITIYEQEHLTPLEMGMRIKAHPTMQVTSALKRRFAGEIKVCASYSGLTEQTIRFPFSRPNDLVVLCEKNLLITKNFLSGLGNPLIKNQGPLWNEIPAKKILEFLEKFTVDYSSSTSRSISLPLIRSYIEQQLSNDELTSWIVAICGRTKEDDCLGEVDWGVGVPIRQIRRTKVTGEETIQALRSPGDEKIILTDEEMEKVNIRINEHVPENRAIKEIRSPKKGLLLIYPISKRSAPTPLKGTRSALFDDSEDPCARDLIGIAVSFPKSNQPQPVETYVTGTVVPREVE